MTAETQTEEQMIYQLKMIEEMRETEGKMSAALKKTDALNINFYLAVDPFHS